MAEVEGHLLSERDVFAPALPAHIPPERFQSVVMTAIARNPTLLRADRRSLLNACCQAAADGLLPDGREGALVIFNTKVKVRQADGSTRDVYKEIVQWMPMVRGVIKRMRQSGDVRGFRTRLVYQKELDEKRFSFRVIDGVEHLNHEPILVDDPGEIVLVYAVADLPDEIQEVEIMNRRQIDRVKRRSKSKTKDGTFYGPWKDDEDEMWRKTVTHRIAKRLPLSAEVMQIINRDEELYELEPDDDAPPPETQDLSVAARRLGGDAPIAEDAQLMEGDAGEGQAEDEEDEDSLSYLDDANNEHPGEPEPQRQETPTEKAKREGKEAAEGGTVVLRKWFDRLPAALKKELLAYKDGTLKPLAVEADKKVAV